MKWVILLVALYITYYSLMYALSLGREKNKFAMYAVIFLSLNTLVLSILVLFKVIRIQS